MREDIYYMDMVFKSGLVKPLMVIGRELMEEIREDFKKQKSGVSSYQNNNIHIKHHELVAVVIIENPEGGQNDGE